jgi:hypothetical protein
MSIVRHLLIQSVDRMSGTTNDYVVKILPLMGVGQVSLLSASIPNTLYKLNICNSIKFHFIFISRTKFPKLIILFGLNCKHFHIYGHCPCSQIFFAFATHALNFSLAANCTANGGFFGVQGFSSYLWQVQSQCLSLTGLTLCGML